MPSHPARLSLAALLVAGSVLVGPSSAQAQEGLSVGGTARYEVDDDGSPVKVSTTIRLTNTTAPTASTYFYWSSYSLWLPTKVTGLRATSAGGSIGITQRRTGGFDYAQLNFPSRLLYGQTRTITVTYSIPGAKFRSTDPARVGPGFASFEVFSPGDTGQGTIEIVSPRWMDLTLSTTYDTEEAGKNQRIATATGGGTDGLAARMALRDPSQKTAKSVTVGKARFDVEAFPGDTKWLGYVTKTLPDALPALAKLTGSPWPETKTAITEDASNNVLGYDGRYTGTAITISERLDRSLLLHELSHAWANFNVLQDRWLVEGLAGALTTRAAKALKTKDEPHEIVSRSAKAAFPLAEWPTASRESGASENYGYPASWWVVDHLLSGATKASQTELVAALTSHGSSYALPGEKDWPAFDVGWRQAYDIFAVLGGNPKTDALMREWVIPKGQQKLLVDRKTSRTRYAALDKVDGAWSLPRGIRLAMSNWKFEEARRGMLDSGVAAGTAGELQQLGKASGVSFESLRESYEGADDVADYRKLNTQFGELTAAMGDYSTTRAAVAEPDNPLDRLGRIAGSPDADLAAAKVALEKGDADAATAALDAAQAADDRAQNIGIAAVAAAGAVLVLALAWVWRRRSRRWGSRRRRPPAPEYRATNE